MQKANSTIAAIASGSGGGVGIIRVSGPEAESIARRLCHPFPDELQSHHLYFGHVYEPAAAPTFDVAHRIDQVLFCLMRAPRSYTGEDVFEIQGHGGAINLRRLLDACIAVGAQAAGPGEFTRRAFLSGKLDLTSAEAVASLISAHSLSAARQAQRHLGGELGRKVAELRRRTLGLLAEFEGTLDFPDLEADAEISSRAVSVLADLATRLDALSQSFSRGGKALLCGIELVLVGRTNAGKSSLVNALCGAERVLVDAEPGTTRDYIETRSEWQGVPVTLIDTAGEREGKSALETEGLRLGRDRAAAADLILLVVDATLGLGPYEESFLANRAAEQPCIVVWNKTDRVGCKPPPQGAIACSALSGWGLTPLQKRILAELAPELDRGTELLVTSARQAALLCTAATALRTAATALSANAAPELVSGELRVATSRLGELTGDAVQEGVLDAIFSQFCVGK